MRGAIPPLPQYAFMAWCSVKKDHRDNFNFTFKVSILRLQFIFMEHYCLRYVTSLDNSSASKDAER